MIRRLSAVLLSLLAVSPAAAQPPDTLPLGSYVVADLFLSRAFGKSTEVYVAVENLLDRIYTTGRTSEGVISTGEPRTARAGVRLRF